MKNIFKLFAFSFILMTLGCEEETIIYGNSTFVQLANSNNVSVVENSGQTVTVAAILGAPQSSDVVVNFDISGSAAPSRYDLSATSFTIPAGDTSGSISLTPIDNDDMDGDAEIIFTLASSSGLPIGIGGEGINAISKKITIVDDNVPCNDFLLTVNNDTFGSETFWDILDGDGNTVASGGTYSDVSGGSTEQETFTLEDGCYTFRMFDFWGDNGAGFVLQCEALIAAEDNGTLNGIPGLDVSTVPSPGFRPASGPADPYDGFAEAYDFCVNQ
ncbi:hypothetical protein DFQ05_2488 [Winogradskyella wandonensis]|uniref:Calx-beta domain-containing protein n=1 Tax=Winogradskyella wandonensis TaxID=1442586 RepID=A0A4V2PT60_9FLAO|nr:hypothetical protein [Winogradskyella wandonensis]TCK65271.1 hypothetical protein DFQ05_2488 [Winogradskyella wandonensis]